MASEESIAATMTHRPDIRAARCILSALLSLTNGTVLGSYEITGRLGAGGMGEVYRAVDKRLDRVVALKVLPASKSSNAELRGRLQKEARTISSLNHPNICTLFDVGETDGTTFLVMEYLEGESVAERLTRGALPPREVVSIALEICEALNRAHRQHIVHRDLKPANVMLTKSGVKLLDFGLAKMIEAGFVLDSNAPTQAPPTAQGTILGTLQYMAPEQLEGREVDARSDIFALGSTLYEMTTGRRPFDGPTQAAVITNILHQDPAPVLSFQTGVPPALARLIEQCLAKDADSRWQTARDIALQLRGIADSPASGSLVARATPSSNSGRILERALFAALLLAFPFLFYWLGGRRSGAVSSDPFTHVSIVLPGKLHLAVDNDVGTIAVAPDGRTVVFAAAIGDEPPSLYVRRLGSFELSRLPKTEGAAGAFFSPDGASIGFLADNKLQKLRLDGGEVETVTSVGPTFGGSWGSDGKIVFSKAGSALFRIPSTGGNAEQLGPFLLNGAQQGSPDYLASLGVVLYTSEVEGHSFDEANIVAFSIPTKRSVVVVHGGSGARYVESMKRLLFVRDRRIWAVPFDPKTMSTTGIAKPIIGPALMYPGSGAAIYDVSKRGDVFLYSTSDAILGRKLALKNRNGTTSFLPFEPRPFEAPHLSADGRRLSLELLGANNDAWMADLDRATLTRVTTARENLTPLISPDGKSIITSTIQAGVPNLYLHRTAESSTPEQLYPSPNPQFGYSWSRDGSRIAFTEMENGDANISLLELSGKRRVIPLVHTPFYDSEPAFSPDGLWIVYVSDDTGRKEVYARRIQGSGERIRISLNGGSEPLWSPTGKEIFFREGNAIMAANVTPESSGEFRIDTPHKLFDTRMGSRTVSRSYDVMPDGNRFVVLERSDLSDSLRHIDIYSAGAEELKPSR